MSLRPIKYAYMEISVIQLYGSLKNHMDLPLRREYNLLGKKKITKTNPMYLGPYPLYLGHTKF